MSKIIDFITELTDKIPSIFNDRKEESLRTESINKTFDDILHEHELLINKVVSNIIDFFMKDKDKDEYILELLDPNVCNDLTIYLTQTLENQYKKYNITKFDDEISVSKEKHKPCTTRDSCTKQLKDIIISTNPQISKWDLCYSVASHYVKMLNVLSAILTGIRPEKNMCIERLNSIYNLVELPDGTQGFEINICRNNKKTVKDRIFEENGMRELINLYILDYMDKSNTDDDLKYMEKEYTKLIKQLNASGLLTKKIASPTNIISNKTPVKKSSITLKTIPIQIQKDSSSQSNSVLIDKITTFEKQIKLVDNKAKATKVTKEISDKIDKLKETSTKLSQLVSNKNVNPITVNRTLQNIDSTNKGLQIDKQEPLNKDKYPTIADTTTNTNSKNRQESSNSESSNSESSNNTSDYNSYSYTSSENSNSSNSKSDQQLLLFITNAYDKLSEIKSATENSSSSYESTQSTNSSNSSGENTSLEGGAFDDKTDSLAEFYKFIKKYQEYWSPEVRSYFDQLINNGFTTGPTAEICSDANVTNKDIFIDIGEIYETPVLMDFFYNFNDMKVDYVSYCDKLISILENDLLETVKEKRVVRYLFRKLSSDDLRDLQKKCRTTLLDMYTNNHNYYIKGIALLKRYYKSSFYKKTKNNKK